MDLNINSDQIAFPQSNQTDNILWSQKVNSKKPSIIYFLISLFVLFIALFLFDFFSNEFSRESLIDLFVNISVTMSATYGIAIYIYRASSTKYYIFKDHIRFEWGFRKKKSVEIPFSDISEIQLVTYNDKDTSTIYFGTGKSYDEIMRLDFENHDTRPHITFEKVKNGKEVHDLLIKLQKATRVK